MSNIKDRILELTREDFLAAFASFEIEGANYPASLYYDISYNGKLYPPKPIIALAYKNRFKEEVKTTDFGQGKGSIEFELIESLGFELVTKKSPIPFRVALYDVHGPAAVLNYENLLSEKDKVFLWDDKRFKKLQVGDFVVWINRKKRQGLLTKVVSRQVKPVFQDDHCLISYNGFTGKAQAKNENQFPNFFAFEILQIENLLSSWNYTDPTTFQAQLMSINLLIEGISQKEISKKIEKLEDIRSAFKDSGPSKQVVDSSIEYLESQLKIKSERNTKRNLNYYLNLFDSLEVKSYLDKIRGAISFFDLKKNDERLVFNYDENGLYFTVGQRYALIYTPKSKEAKYFICSKEKIGNLGLDKQFDGPPIVFFSRRNELDLSEVELSAFHDALQVELQRSNKSRYLMHHKKDFADFVFDGIESSETKKWEFVNSFINEAASQNLLFSSFLTKRYIASLATKPFVIFTGLSGSGKTKLTQTFAKWICESEQQYKIIPIGADWTNREPLLGYPNSLDPSKYVLPDNGALDLILAAIEDAKDKELKDCKPFFLILDEMNLSHVERYFADFLSGMESKEAISLYTGNDRKDENGRIIPKEINLSPNLFLVGTVNVDETTYMFSPKVLDRANTIEFRIEKDDIIRFFDVKDNQPIDVIDGKGSTYSGDLMSFLSKQTEQSNPYQKQLLEFFKALQPIGAEFGYRTANEMNRLIASLELLGMEKTESALDVAVMQKLLPKLHGSRTKLNKVLPILASFCFKSCTTEQAKTFLDEFKQEGKLKGETKPILPLSFTKIARMYAAAQENGFASYAEG